MKHIGRRYLTLAAAFAVGLSLGLVGYAGRASAAPPRQLPKGDVPLPVPYVSQMYVQERQDGAVTLNGRNNCGPASLAMVIEANGGRPAGLNGQQFVAQIRQDMTGVPDRKGQGFTSWEQVDHGASLHGLICPNSTSATSINLIRTWTDQCTPVIALIAAGDASVQTWIDNPESNKGDHFIVIVGVRNGYVWYLNPMIYSPSGAVPADASRAMRITTEARMEAALNAAATRTKGRAYGRSLGNCDANGCGGPPGGGPGGGGGGGGLGPTVTPPQPWGPPEVFDHVDVSMGSACTDKEVKLFYIAGNSSGFSERRSVRRWLRDGSQGYEKLTFDLDSRENWNGRLKQLRFDPTGSSSDCDTGFSWIHITNDRGSSAKFYDFYNHADDPHRPLGRMLGWTAARMLDLGPRSSWQLHVHAADPQLVNADVDIETGR